jgi:Uma2 family endonuclease
LVRALLSARRLGLGYNRGVSVPASKQRFSYAEYVEREQAAVIKHEWIAGEIFAMSGGTPEHARLQATLARVLGNALLDGPCKVYSSDLRVRSRTTELATYADLTIVCSELELDPDDANAVTNPTLLVEVLSPSTEAYDRGQKAAHYRQMPSVQEYVLVAQDAPRIEVFRRGQDGHWSFIEAGPGESLRLESIRCTLAVDDVFGRG